MIPETDLLKPSGGIWCLWSQRPVCQPLSLEFSVLDKVGFSSRNMDHFHAFWPVFLHKFTWLFIIFYNTGKECSSSCLQVHCPQYTEIMDFFSVKKRYLKKDTFIHLLKQFVRAIKPLPERVVNLFVAFLNCVTSLPHTWILSVPGNRTSTSSSLNGNWSHMLWLSDAFTTYPTWEGPLLFVRFDPELHQSI